MKKWLFIILALFTFNFLSAQTSLKKPVYWYWSNDTIYASIDGQNFTSTKKLSTWLLPVNYDSIFVLYSDSLSKIQDSLSRHTDTLEVHNDRISAGIQRALDSLKMHSDTLLSHNDRINAEIQRANDSLKVHLDSLQSHNTRILAVLDSITNGHYSKQIIDILLGLKFDKGDTIYYMKTAMINALLAYKFDKADTSLYLKAAMINALLAYKFDISDTVDYYKKVTLDAMLAYYYTRSDTSDGDKGFFPRNYMIAWMASKFNITDTSYLVPYVYLNALMPHYYSRSDSNSATLGFYSRIMMDAKLAEITGTGLITLNGLSGVTQTFAIDTTISGAPAWLSTGTSHTLQLPFPRFLQWKDTVSLVMPWELGAYSPIAGSSSFTTAGTITSGSLGTGFTEIDTALTKAISRLQSLDNFITITMAGKTAFIKADTSQHASNTNSGWMSFEDKIAMAKMLDSLTAHYNFIQALQDSIIHSLRTESNLKQDTINAYRLEFNSLWDFVYSMTSPPVYDESNIYVNPVSGFDAANNGHNPALPLATLTKAVSLIASPDDSIFVMGNDTLWEGVTVTPSGTAGHPIVITNYNGNTPVISGGERVTGWVQNGTVWACKPAGTVYNLHVGDVQQVWARTPNVGNYFRTDAGTTTTKIISADITVAEDALVGANLNIYSGAWSWEANKYIYSNKNDSLGVNTLTWTAGTNYAFYINGNLPSLGDTCGEWWMYNDSLYYIPSTGVNPNTLTMIATEENYGIQIAGDYVTVQNLQFANQALSAITQSGVTTPDYITIQDCVIKNQWRQGIDFYNASTHLTLLRDSVINCNWSGINFYESTNSTVSYCHVARIGTVAGLCNQPFGIITDADNNDILYNRVDSTGNSGVYGGSHNTIAYNYVSNSGLSSNDVGGIYVGGKTGTRIYNNFVQNVVGEASLFGGTIPTATMGLYSDAASDGNYWGYNIVQGVMHTGYFNQYNTVRDTIIGNIFHNLKTPTGAAWYYYVSAIEIKNYAQYTNHGQLVVKDNVIFTDDTSSYAIHYTQHTLSPDSAYLPVGTISGNIYINPMDKDRLIWKDKENTTDYLNLSQWVDTTGETGYKSNWRQWYYGLYDKDSLFINTTASNYDYTVAGSTWKNYEGTLETTTLTVPAYSAALRFNSPDSDTLLTYYPEANYDTDGIMSVSNGTAGRSQAFIGDGNYIGGFRAYVKRIGTSGYYTPRLCANIGGGTYGGTARPVTNASLVVGDSVLTSGYSTDNALVDFYFQTPYKTVNGTIYHIGLTTWDASSSNCLSWGRDASSSSHAGNPAAAGNPAGAWSQLTSDHICYIYTRPSP